MGSPLADAIAPASVLDKERPSAHTVLGNKLAVWYNADKQTWNVFDDACPHRQARARNEPCARVQTLQLWLCLCTVPMPCEQAAWMAGN